MAQGHAKTMDWSAEVAGRLIAHIEAQLAVGVDFATARAVAATCSTAGPLTWRLVDQHFAIRAAA